jgi:hypothetical protein
MPFAIELHSMNPIAGPIFEKSFALIFYLDVSLTVIDYAVAKIA